MLNKELQGCKKDSMNNPNWVLLYKMKWMQLSDIVITKNKRILDFGSGFGTTANFLAKDNEVIAIDPNVDMIEVREQENNYTQIIGKYDKLNDFSDNSFDIIVCHNVLEFASERAEIVKEFSRILKSGGILSIVKNNGNGRIMSKVVSANDINKAIDLLEGGYISNTFGRVDLYNPNDLIKWGSNLKIEKILALQTFFGLQQNDIKNEPEWIEKMFEIEMMVCDLEPYKSISLFNHILLRKL